MMRRLSLVAFALSLTALPACDDDGSRQDDAGFDAGPDAAVVDSGEDNDAAQQDAGVDAIAADGGGDAEPDVSLPDSGPVFCTLQIATLNGLPIANINQIDSTLDQSEPKPGFQVDVGVRVIGAPSGQPVQLAVTGVTTDAETSSVNGIATFSGVTVNSSFSTVVFAASSTGCTSSGLRLDVQADPTCTIIAPADGVTLTTDDDKDSGNDTFEVDVQVQTNSRSIGGVARLQVDGRDQGTETVVGGGVPGGAGATFENIIFGPGTDVRLVASVRLGELEATCEAVIDVDIPGPPCAITALVAPPNEPVNTSQGPGLGPDQDSDIAQDDLQTTISVTSNTTATSITLRDGTTVLGTLTPTDGSADFAITLSDGPHRLNAICSDDGGASNRADANVLVDITPPTTIGDLFCFTKCLDTTCPTGDPSLSDNREGKVTCRFSSADGTGSVVERYLLRYRENSAISEANWDADDTEEIPLTPVVGVQQSDVVEGFRIPNTYSYAVKAVDILGNVSEISNVTEAKIDFRTQVVGGGAEGNLFGSQIVTGDFTCDGLTDVAIGESGEGTNNQGRVRVFAGTSDGLTTTAVATISATVDDGYFGIILASLDFNGDGCDDLAVRAATQDDGRGRVYLYLGRDGFPAERSDVNSGTGAEAVYRLQLGDETTSQALGQAVAGVDLDGDGNDDLAMTHWDTADSQFANVVIDYGNGDLPFMEAGAEPVVREMPTESELTVAGGSYSAWFGQSLARGGLLDRDTADRQQELLIGAPLHVVGDQSVGAAYVLKGADRGSSAAETISIADSPRIVTIVGDAAEGSVRLGLHLAGLGDTDGDGIAEFAVADTDYTEEGETRVGRVYVFNLDAPLPQSVLDAEAILSNGFSVKASNRFGRMIAKGRKSTPDAVRTSTATCCLTSSLVAAGRALMRWVQFMCSWASSVV
jgi:hypothetical protein